MPLELRSTITSEGQLELSLAEVDMPVPGDDEVVVRMEAAPINPSDLGLLLGFADVTTAKASGTADRPVVTADVPQRFMGMMTPRLDQAMPVGNEGAGVVVAAGTSDAAQALMGKTVGMIGGASYSQFRAVNVMMVQAMPDGVTPAQAAAWFVNPMTALAMTEVMKMEGYPSLSHTAAASNLGQMLQKICTKDGISLVNIVRKPEQATLLKGIGADYVCDSSAPSFADDLTNAFAATNCTLCFDATGGGTLQDQILTAMEAAINRNATEYNRYGSDVHKQVYIYGGLERSKTELNRSYGMSWGVSGWLLTPFLTKVGVEKMLSMRQRVADEITTTFASSYTAETSLAETLSLEAISTYAKQATGEKYLVCPNKDL